MSKVHSEIPSILLDLNEGASALRVSRSTVKRLIGEGRLPVVRIGRRVLLRRDALEAFLDEQTQPAA